MPSETLYFTGTVRGSEAAIVGQSGNQFLMPSNALMCMYVVQ